MTAVDREAPPVFSDVVDATPDYATLEAAAEWFALLRSGAATEQERASWRCWLDQRDEHRDAWQFVDAVSRRFETFQSRDEQQAAITALNSTGVLGSTGGAPLTRRRALNLLALGTGAGVFGWAALRQVSMSDWAQSWGAAYRTATGEMRAVTLADGSRAWLNTATTLDVDYQKNLRRLRLFAGEVLIDTAHDATLPFVVDTVHGRLRALGTRFTVRSDDAASLLSVSAGAVEIRTAKTGETRVVGAGRQLRFDGNHFATESAASAAAEGWINGVLLAEDLPLGALIDELKRYRHGHISVAPEVASLRVLGGFPLRDPDRVLAMLEDALPIRVRRTLPWWISIEAREIAS